MSYLSIFAVSILQNMPAFAALDTQPLAIYNERVGVCAPKGGYR